MIDNMKLERSRSSLVRQIYNLAKITGEILHKNRELVAPNYWFLRDVVRTFSIAR